MEKTNFYKEIEGNNMRTFFLFIAFFVFFVIIGYVIGYALLGSGILGIPVALLIAVPYSLISYFAGDKIALAVSGAKLADPREFMELHNLVEGMAIAAGIPKPKVYVIYDDSPNAFATGRDEKHASIAVTTGVMKLMNRQETEGVIAHEIGHVLNRDMKVMTLAAIMVGGIAILSDLFLRSMFWGGGRKDRSERGNLGIIMFVLAIVLAVLAPIVAQIIRLAISRSREYLADATSAKLTRYPPGLASALTKINAYSKPVQGATNATAHMYIANPLGKGFWSGLFSTHPPIEERVRRLQSM